MTDDLVSWLRERLDEDERLAQQADGDGEVEWIASDAKEHYLPRAGAHIEHWLPSRALAEVQAKRAILNHLAEIDQRPDWPIQARNLARYTLLLLAAVFSDRPGYQEDWRP